MALNEEKILSGKFVFISYSHEDKETVLTDVRTLISMGVRVWFDENMRIADNWTEIANRVLHHENCGGVIFYNSYNSFASNAVQQEQQIVRNLNLRYWAVHLSKKKTATIAFEAMNYIVQQYGMANPLFTKHMSEVMPAQQELFKDEKLCIMRGDDSLEVVKKIYDQIAVPYHFVDNEDNFLSNCQKNEMASAGSNEIVFGKYVSGEYFGPERPDNMADQRFGDMGDMIQLNGKRYMTQELRWRLLYVKDGKAVLLCNKILRQDTFFAGKAFLETVFCNLAFSPEEWKRFGGITARYITAQDIEACLDASAFTLAEVAKLKHWWIDENGLTVNWKQTYSDDIHYEIGFSCLIKKGIRPVIEVPAGILN